jgi:hypothetical protein
VTSPLADDQAVLIIPSGDELSEDVVRIWATGALAGVPMVPRLRAVLVVEELVSNALRHGRLPCVLQLLLDETRRYLLVLVEDSAPDDGAMWPMDAGLVLVDGLTSDWAVEPRALGKTVWAEIPLGARISGLAVPPQPPPSGGPQWPWREHGR